MVRKELNLGRCSPCAWGRLNFATGAKKRALNHDCSENPRQGAPKNSTWPAPLAGHGSRCCLFGSRVRRLRLVVCGKQYLTLARRSNCRLSTIAVANRYVVVVSLVLVDLQAVRANPISNTAQSLTACPVAFYSQRQFPRQFPEPLKYDRDCNGRRLRRSAFSRFQPNWSSGASPMCRVPVIPARQAYAYSASVGS